MYKKIRPLFIRAITPVHVGCGSDLGIVDLPIQREKHTTYPKIESSGIKGSIREFFEYSATSKQDIYDIHNLFGYDKDSINTYNENGKIVNIKSEVDKKYENNFQYVGAVGFTDARILLFPVKSVRGVFAWVTCFGVLKKFEEEMNLRENNSFKVEKVNVKEEEAYCSENSALCIGDNIILDEYLFKVKNSKRINSLIDNLNKYLNIQDLDKRLVVVSDNDFKDFVNMSTEVITRTKIDSETGTVKDGALFTEEYLPSETIMYSMVLISPSFSAIGIEDNMTLVDVNSVEEIFDKKMNNEIVIQIGAGSTIGKGIIKIRKG